jgi:thiol-disulfide isomerase/thioredoxin
MKWMRNPRRILVWIISLLFVYGTVTLPVRAQQPDDEATKIYQLARSLHQENTDRGAFTLWVNGDIGGDLTARRTALSAGDPLPDFTLTLFGSGDTLTSEDVKGPYILNFWSSWCSVCLAEMRLFDQKITDGSLTVPVIFVDTLDYQGAGKLFIDKLEVKNTLTFAFDEDSKFFQSLWFSVNPDNVLVDAEGYIQAIQIGGMSDLSLEFFNEIALNPGVGAFDRLNPDVQPPAPEAAPDATSESQASSTSG